MKGLERLCVIGVNQFFEKSKKLIEGEKEVRLTEDVLPIHIILNGDIS
jgi:hypothetical protein